MTKPKSAFKLLHIDIETTPLTALTWGTFKQNISVDQIVKPTSVLCFAAKWHGEGAIVFKGSVKQDGTAFNSMIRSVHRLLSEADGVCHFNGTTFDIPRLNNEFVRLGLPPTPPIPQIDLKKVVKTKFDMTSGRLAFVGPYLGIGEKVKNSGWELWIKCMAGDKDAWAEMEKYNKQDVLLLESLYLRLLPWIDGHPNMNLYVDETEPVCPTCNSEKLQRRGEYKTLTNVYHRYVCGGCGKWSRARKAEKAFRTELR